LWKRYFTVAVAPYHSLTAERDDTAIAA
jgi:hypothetical protein